MRNKTHTKTNFEFFFKFGFFFKVLNGKMIKNDDLEVMDWFIRLWCLGGFKDKHTCIKIVGKVVIQGNQCKLMYAKLHLKSMSCLCWCRCCYAYYFYVVVAYGMMLWFPWLLMYVAKEMNIIEVFENVLLFLLKQDKRLVRKVTWRSCDARKWKIILQNKGTFLS